MVCDHPVNILFPSHNYQQIHETLAVKRWYVIVRLTSICKSGYMINYQHIHDVLPVKKWYVIIRSTSHIRVRIFDNYQHLMCLAGSLGNVLDED
jgi:hypothetical protein